MTPERLAFIEAHFRNPHSVAGLSEYGLELVEELRLHIRPAFGITEAIMAMQFEPPAVRGAPFDEPIPLHELPTPPMGIVIDDRVEPKKKGKR